MAAAQNRQWADIILHQDLRHIRIRAVGALIVLAGILLAGVVVSGIIGVVKARAVYRCPPHLSRRSDGSCAECSERDGGLACGGAMQCDSDGKCVQCLSNSDCQGGVGGDGRTGTGSLTEVCGRDHTCRRECSGNADCVGFPRGGVCVDGACSECELDSQCAQSYSGRPFCHVGRAECVECQSNAQCSDGRACSESDGACGPACLSDDDCGADLSFCTGGVCTRCRPYSLSEGCDSHAPRCNDTGTECLECARDDDCPGALMLCNADRRCEPIFPAAPRFALYSGTEAGATKDPRQLLFLGLDPPTGRLTAASADTVVTAVLAQSPRDPGSWAIFVAPAHTDFRTAAGLAPLGVIPFCVGAKYGVGTSAVGCSAPAGVELLAPAPLRPYASAPLYGITLEDASGTKLTSVPVQGSAIRIRLDDGQGDARYLGIKDGQAQALPLPHNWTLSTPPH